MPPGFGEPQIGPLISQWLLWVPGVAEKGLGWAFPQSPSIGLGGWVSLSGVSRTGRQAELTMAHVHTRILLCMYPGIREGIRSHRSHICLCSAGPARPQTLRTGPHHPQRSGLGHPMQVTSARALLGKGARELEEGPNSCAWDKMSQGGRPPEHRTPLLRVGGSITRDAPQDLSLLPSSENAGRHRPPQTKGWRVVVSPFTGRHQTAGPTPAGI